EDGARIRLDIAGDEAQRRRLTATGRTEERDELMVADLKIEFAYRRHAGVLSVIALRQATDADARHYPPTPAVFSALGGLIFKPTRAAPNFAAIEMATPMIATLTIASAATGSLCPVSYRL